MEGEDILNYSLEIQVGGVHATTTNDILGEISAADCRVWKTKSGTCCCMRHFEYHWTDERPEEKRRVALGVCLDFVHRHGELPLLVRSVVLVDEALRRQAIELALECLEICAGSLSRHFETLEELTKLDFTTFIGNAALLRETNATNSTLMLWHAILF